MPKFNTDIQVLRHVHKKLKRVTVINNLNLAQRAAKELLAEIDEYFNPTE